MSVCVEDENGKISVYLTENDYINVLTLDKKSKFVIKNIDGKLIVEEMEVIKDEKN